LRHLVVRAYLECLLRSIPSCRTRFVRLIACFPAALLPPRTVCGSTGALCMRRAVVHAARLRVTLAGIGTCGLAARRRRSGREKRRRTIMRADHCGPLVCQFAAMSPRPSLPSSRGGVRRDPTFGSRRHRVLDTQGARHAAQQREPPASVPPRHRRTPSTAPGYRRRSRNTFPRDACGGPSHPGPHPPGYAERAFATDCTRPQ
jgi:hypothetical protein